MYVGIPNPNIVMPLEKMSITNLRTKKKIYVLYNPESYQQSRQVSYAANGGFATNMPVAQFTGGASEQLSFQLFFDSMSAGAEVGGSAIDKALFTANSLLPSAGKQIDVREYTEKIYTLMLIDPSLHVPPKLKLEWNSLQFTGFLIACTQRFTRFNESGMPVRATLDCTFQEYVEASKIASLKPNESPDTTKYRVVHQGDSLGALAAKEYGQAGNWRQIAQANGIDNPRKLRSGDMLALPSQDG